MTRKLPRKTEIVSWVFVLIPSLFIVLFYFVPMVQALILSFQSGKGIHLKFVAFDNYLRLIKDPDFLTAVKNTVLFLIVQVPIMVLLAMIFAVLLNKKSLKWKGFFRTLVFLPSVTSLVAYSIVFKYLFSPDGAINKILMEVGLAQSPILWLADPFWSKILIILAITWRWTGYNMIFFLSALQNIDPCIYEAARLDGVNPRQEFFRITVPLLRPVILFTSITSTIGTLQLFDEPMNITGGGPGNATMTISQYIYNLSFEYTPDFGYAATVSYAIVILVIFFSILQVKAGAKDD